MACRIKHCALISGDNGNPYDWNDGRLTSYLHIGSTTFSWSNIKKMALNLATFVFSPRCSSCVWFFSWVMTPISKSYLPLRQFWACDWIPRAWRLSGFRLFPCPVINFQDPTSQHPSYYSKFQLMKLFILELDLQEKNVRYDRGSRYTCAKRKRIPTIKSTGPTQNSCEIEFQGLTPQGSCGESHAMEVTWGGSEPLDFISQIRSG